MLPDYNTGQSTGAKKIIPYLSYKVTRDEFVGNNENNEKVPFKINQGDNILFDLNNIVSGYHWFAGGGNPPEKVFDTWNITGDKADVSPAKQPPAKMNADGQQQNFRRFAEIPIYSSMLKTRIFSFDGASTYKTAQSIVAQWLKNRSNQNGTVYMYQFSGIRRETNPKDKTRQLLIPEFEFKQELSRPADFDLITPMGNKTNGSSSDNMDDDMPF
jgi:hypothetical protein